LSLRFLGGDTGDGGSPRLYQEGDDFLVQGYTVTETQLLTELKIPEGETVVRVPQSLWKYLPARQRIDQRIERRWGEQMPVLLGHDAVHREMRELYAAVAEEDDDAAWPRGMSDLAGCPAGREAYRRHWLGLMSAKVGLQEALRDGRVMPEPATGGTRSGEAPVSLGSAPAEQVRRLLRRGTSALMPVTGLRVIDGTTRLVNHFSSDGTWVGSEMIDSSALARQFSSAFDAVWELSAPRIRGGPG
jgi:hypothetical protein